MMEVGGYWGLKGPDLRELGSCS